MKQPQNYAFLYAVKLIIKKKHVGLQINGERYDAILASPHMFFLFLRGRRSLLFTGSNGGFMVAPLFQTKKLENSSWWKHHLRNCFSLTS